MKSLLESKPAIDNAPPMVYSVFYSESAKFYYVRPPFPDGTPTFINETIDDLLVLTGYIANDTQQTGWYRLQLTGVRGVPDTVMMTAAGFLEGLLSAPLIDDAIANYAMDTSNKTLMNDLRSWFSTWGDWMQTEAIQNSATSPYWQHIGLIFKQMDGLVIGHNLNCPSGCSALALIDILLLSPSVMDIITVISGTPPQWSQLTPRAAELLSAQRMHCSALIRRLPNGDVALGHTTWNMYTGMVRLFKSYTLPLAAPQTRAITITFSSYPGALYSGDDFIMMPDTQLVVSETTNDIFDNHLYDLVKPTGTVLTWLRFITVNPSLNLKYSIFRMIQRLKGSERLFLML